VVAAVVTGLAESLSASLATAAESSKIQSAQLSLAAAARQHARALGGD